MDVLEYAHKVSNDFLDFYHSSSDPINPDLCVDYFMDRVRDRDDYPAFTADQHNELAAALLTYLE